MCLISMSYMQETLTNTNAVSGFESMGTMLGGGMEKAGSSMQTMVQRQQDKADKADPNKSGSAPATTNTGTTPAAQNQPYKTGGGNVSDARGAAGTGSGGASDPGGRPGSSAPAHSGSPGSSSNPNGFRSPEAVSSDGLNEFRADSTMIDQSKPSSAQAPAPSKRS